MATQLGSKPLMSIVKIRENGTLQDFYVVRHNAYAGGRTLLLRRYTHSNRQWHTSISNAYANSDLDAWFNGGYFNTLPADIQRQIAAVTIPYTPGYTGGTNLSTLSRKVFALSATELGKSDHSMNVEGTALADASTLRFATDSNGTAKEQLTRSPNTDYIANVWNLDTDGSLISSGCTFSRPARPAFTLPSSLSADYSDNVSFNMAPVINYSGSTSLGNKTEGFTLNYSVSDADGDTVTATEKMDGSTKRTHNPALGVNQQFQTVLPANFQTILNGNHTLTLEATDGKESAAPVNITFTKAVYSCSVTLTTPLKADAMPEAMRLTITGNIPSDAVWTAQVCNNGGDTNPTWENIKPAVQAGYNYIFSNKSKTAAKWGINFRINMRRGSSNTGGYIYAIEGGFK